eukprot:scaffold245589_cov15-Tisochrysis_lutea.AAC.1
MDLSKRKDARAVRQALALAQELGVKISKVSRHELNTLSADKVHQGGGVCAQLPKPPFPLSLHFLYFSLVKKNVRLFFAACPRTWTTPRLPPQAS